MPDIQQYSVSIKFKAEGSEATEDKVKRLEEQLAKLKSSGSINVTKGLGLDKIAKTAGKFAAGFTAAIGTAAAGSKKLFTSIKKLSGETSDYIETVNLFRASMGSAADDATDFINRAESDLGLDPKSMMDSIAAFQNLSEGIGISSDRAYIMSKNLTQLSGDLSSFANISFEQAQKKLLSGFSGQVKPLRQYGIALDQTSLQETAYSLGLEQKVKNMTRAQKTELIYYQIMKSTQKIQGDLGRSIMSPANSLRVLQTEFTKLARAVGSIFIPGMMRIIPVVRMITQALTSAAQAIAGFFGFEMSDYYADLSSVGNLLDGVADDVDDVGDSAEGTAKKLNKMLMPFDELNNITSSTKSGSGTGGLLSGGSLGIDLPEYDMFASLDENFKKMMEGNNWYEISAKMARDISKGLNEIPWEEIQQKAKETGQNIALFLNGGIENMNWKLLGSTLAQGLNTSFDFIGEFFSTFNFAATGKTIADTIMGLFTNIDWQNVGKVFSDGFSGAFDTLLLFWANMDVDKIWGAIWNIVKGIDWGRLLLQFGQLLALNYIKVSPLGILAKAILAGIQGMINTAIGILNNIKIPVPKWLQEWLGLPEEISFNIQEINLDLDDLVKSIANKQMKLSDIVEDGAEDIEKTAEKVEDTVAESSQNASEAATRNYEEAFAGVKKNMDSTKSIFETTYNQMANSSVFTKIQEKIKSAFDQAHNSEQWGQDTASSYTDGINNSQKGIINLVNDINLKIQSALNQSDKSGSWGSATTENYNRGLASQSNPIMDTINYVNSIIRNGLVNDNSYNSGSSTMYNYNQGLNSQNNPIMRTVNNVNATIRNALNNSNSYTWGQDMMEGMMKGIKAKLNKLADTGSLAAKVISSYIHFSKPDVGPLRDYEQWMPDMVKGLSDSLISALPVLDNATARVSETLANSLRQPYENDVFITKDITSNLIDNVRNNAAQSNQSQVTEGIANAAYNGISRALAENTGNGKQQVIQINIGNEQIYSGYGSYKDEESNMLGVST